MVSATGGFPPRSAGDLVGHQAQQETDRNSANVQPIFTGDDSNSFGNAGFVFGSNQAPSHPTCGDIIRKVVCSDNEAHKPYYKHQYCNDPLCPVCFSKFTNRIAEGAIERVSGYRSVYGYDPIYHLAFWPGLDVGYKNLKFAMADAKDMLDKMGAIMAVVWYHPWRIKEEIKVRLREYKKENNLDKSTGFWKLAHQDVLGLGSLRAYLVYGPHFHAIASGYLKDRADYQKETGNGYKKIRYLDTQEKLERMARYVSTHACYESHKSTVRYFGKISYSRLARDDGEEVFEDVVCAVCGKPLIEYHYSHELNQVTGLAHDHVTRKVMRYRYWKRGDKPQGLKKSCQYQLIPPPF